MKKFLLGLVALGFAAAVAIQFLPAILPTPPTTKEAALTDILVSELEGWRIQDVPIADTEEMKAQVESRLVYDDSVVRLYERGNTSVMVYVAYWSPGKMPYRMVGAHSPDTCWVQNGWTRRDRSQWATCPNGQAIRQPIEWGTYARPGTLQHVLFWHLVGGESYGFDQLGGHNVWGVFHDYKRFGLQQRREQFFVRISANRPLEEIWYDPGFQQILAPVSRLGVQAGSDPLIPLQQI
jgi:hypothetical protein